MKKLILPLLILFLSGCFSFNTPTTPCWTEKHPEEGAQEFISEAMWGIRDKFPQWYQEDVTVRALGENQDEGKRMALTKVNLRGQPYITIVQGGLDLCEVSSMEYVLLHEYVHAKIWKRLETEIEDEECLIIRHELEAYLVNLQTYEELQYHPTLQLNAALLYADFYRKAEEFCAEKIHEDLPHPFRYLFEVDRDDLPASKP